MRRLLDSDEHEIRLVDIPLCNSTWRCGYLESIDDFFVYVGLKDDERGTIELDFNKKGKNFVEIIKSIISEMELRVYFKNNTRINGYEQGDFGGLSFYSHNCVLLNLGNIFNLNLKSKKVVFENIPYIIKNTKIQGDLIVFDGLVGFGNITQTSFSKNFKITNCENFEITSKIFYSNLFGGTIKTYYTNISNNYNIGDSLQNIENQLFKYIHSDVYLIFDTRSLKCYVIIKKNYLTTSQKSKYKMYDIKDGYVIFSRSLKRMSYKKWINDFVKHHVDNSMKIFL